jgi:uncharacterized protein (TIGR03437 family)
VGGIATTIFYVSPTQINFLVPSIMLPGRTDIQVTLDGIAGPRLPLNLAAFSPALFQLDAQTIVATRPDGSVITAAAPARPGDVIILYATGLGDTVPPVIERNLAFKAAPLKNLTQFQVLLDRTPIDSHLVLYAGIAPGFAGLYQINVQLPSAVGSNPQVQIAIGDVQSPAGLRLPLSPQ